MLAFGGLLTIADIGAVLAYNLDFLFIGRVLGSAALGFYSIAFRLPELIILNLATVAAERALPGLRRRRQIAPQRGLSDDAAVRLDADAAADARAGGAGRAGHPDPLRLPVGPVGRGDAG